MKKLTFACFAALCLAICFTACGEDEAPEMPEMPEMEELIVTPGVGINDLKIGDLGSKVSSELGEGFVRIVNVGGSGNATYNYFNDPEGMDIIFGQYNSGGLDIDTLPIKSFNLFGDFEGMTEEGIKIGSAKVDVIAAYGEPDEIEWGVNVYNIGILISYNDMDEVRDITILEI